MQNMERRPIRTGHPKHEEIKMLKRAIEFIELSIDQESDETKKSELEKSLIELKVKLIKEEGIKKEDSLGDFSPVLDDHIIRNEKHEIENIRQELLNEQELLEQENPTLSLYFDKKARLVSVKEHIDFIRNEIEANIDNSEYILNEKIAELRKYEGERDETESFLNQEIQKPEIKYAVENTEKINLELKSLDSHLEKIHKLSDSDQEKRSDREVLTNLN